MSRDKSKLQAKKHRVLQSHTQTCLADCRLATRANCLPNNRKLKQQHAEIFFFFFNPANADGDSHGVRKVAAAAATAAMGTPEPPAAAELWHDEIG